MPFSQIIPPSPSPTESKSLLFTSVSLLLSRIQGYLVWVRYRIQDAWGWCTGMTQRDGKGREVGGGFRSGNLCTPVADSCWCMAKPIQYCKVKISSVQFSLSVVSTLCDPMNRSTPGLPVHHQLLEFTQSHANRVSDAIQPSHPRSSPSPSAPNPSQHQSLLQ